MEGARLATCNSLIVSNLIYGSVALKETTDLVIHLLLLSLTPAGWLAVSLGILGAVPGGFATTDNRPSSRSSRLRVNGLPGDSHMREHWISNLISVLVWIYWMLYLFS